MNFVRLQRITRAITLLILFFVSILSVKAQTTKKTYVIASEANMEYVLAVPNSQYRNGVGMILWRFNMSYKDQKFKFRKTPAGVAISPAENLSMSVAIPEGKVGENNMIILWENTNSHDQAWRLEHISGMVYVIRSVINPDYVLSINGSPQKNSRLVLKRYVGSDNQRWVLWPTDNPALPILSE